MSVRAVSSERASVVAAVVLSHRRRSTSLSLSSGECVLGGFDLPEQRSLEVGEFLVPSVESGGFLEVGLSSLSKFVDLSGESFPFGGERFELLTVLLLDDFETSREGSRQGGLVTVARRFGGFEEVSAPGKNQSETDGQDGDACELR